MSMSTKLCWWNRSSVRRQSKHFRLDYIIIQSLHPDLSRQTSIALTLVKTLYCSTQENLWPQIWKSAMPTECFMHPRCSRRTRNICFLDFSKSCIDCNAGAGKSHPSTCAEIWMQINTYACIQVSQESSHARRWSFSRITLSLPISRKTLWPIKLCKKQHSDSFRYA